MKQKIKEALKQGHKNLGLSEEVFERVAASVETFITDESAIEGFVKSENTLNLLKSYQSVNDKLRALENKPKNEPATKPSETGNQTEEPQPDIAAAVAAAVAAEMAKVVTPLQEKLTAFEAAKAKETAVAALDEFVNGWDYAKGYPKESELSKRIALKIYKAGGEKMTGEELIAAFREEFDPAVKAKGVTDFSKPFESDGGGKKDEPKFDSFDRAAKELGWNKPEK